MFPPSGWRVVIGWGLTPLFATGIGVIVEPVFRMGQGLPVFVYRVRRRIIDPVSWVGQTDLLFGFGRRIVEPLSWMG